MVPEIVQARLRGLRSKLRALVTLEGLARILVVLGLLVILTFLFDKATPLPAALRLILTLLCAAILVVTLWRSLLVPLAMRMTDDQIAIAAERRFPDLKDRLISTVQFRAKRTVSAIKTVTHDCVSPLMNANIFAGPLISGEA